METDDEYRARIAHVFRHHWNGGKPEPCVEGCIASAKGSKLEEWGRCYNVERGKPYQPDPFGDAIRSAQEPLPEPPPTYTPDDFTAPGFDADAAYRRAMGL